MARIPTVKMYLLENRLKIVMISGQWTPLNHVRLIETVTMQHILNIYDGIISFTI